MNNKEANVSLFNSTQSSRIGLEVVSVRAVGKKQHQDVSDSLDLLSQSSTTTQKLLDSSHHDIIRRFSPLSQIHDTTREVLSLVSTHEEGMEAFRKELNDGFRQLSWQINSRLDTLNLERASESAPLRDEADLGHLTRRFQYRGVSVRTRRRGFCLSDCACRCHAAGDSSHQWRLPRGMSYLFGSLFVRFTGRPACVPPCNSNICLGKQSTRVEATYIFPTWLIWCHIYIMVERAAGQKPEMVLALKNRVAFRHSPFFQAARHGDVHELALILKAAPHCLNDIEDIYGTTPLYYAAFYGHLEAVKLLLRAGANPEQQHDDGDSVKLIFARLALTQGDESKIFRLLGIQDYLKDEMIPELIKAILRLPGCCKMETLIQKNKARTLAEAKTEDCFSHTALHWACLRGDVDAVRRLLDLGADVQTRAQSCTPLHCAAQNKEGGLACARLLFRAGAKFKLDGQGESPLQLACRFGAAETVAEMIRNGASLEERSVRGNGLLHYAVEGNNFTVVDWLLDHCGVNIETITLGRYPGHTALMLAVYHNSYLCTRSLLLRGASYYIYKTEQVWTVLHQAANYADTRTLHVLAHHGLKGIDIYAKHNGRTAQDMINLREAEPEIIAAFDELLDAIRQANARQEVDQAFSETMSLTEGCDYLSDEASEDETFYDAMEYHFS